MKTLSIPVGRKVAVSSDCHWSHRNILKYCKRPWLYLDSDNHRREAEGLPYEVSDRALKAHDDAIVEAINEAVGFDDLLFLLGDVAWGEAGGAGLKKLHEFRERINCREIWVTPGNHDDDNDLCEVFGATRVHERLRVVIGGPGGNRELIASHYPEHSWMNSHKGSIHCYGHVHRALDKRHEEHPGWLLSLDVGVDSHDYRPWLWHEEIVPLMDRRYAKWKEWRDVAYATPKDKGGMVTNAR